jgi:hypothetical protein
MKDISFNPDVPMEGGAFGDALNIALLSLQGNIAGVLTKSVAGGAGTTTLTNDESYNGILIFTGALTGNRIVEVPAAAMRWSVVNKTTGGYTLTLQTPLGAGVVLPTDHSINAWSDGTDVLTTEPSGIWTPTHTLITNLAASTSFACIYSRVGRVVHFSGSFGADPTSTGAWVLRMTPPIPSAFTDALDAGGTIQSATVDNQGGAISANTAGGLLTFSGYASVNTNVNYGFSGHYLIK